MGRITSRSLNRAANGLADLIVSLKEGVRTCLTRDHYRRRGTKDALKAYDKRWGKWLLGFSVAYLVVVYLEILPGFPAGLWLTVLDGALWAIFVVDWVWRVFFLAPSPRWRYALFSVQGILDIFVLASFPVLLKWNTPALNLFRIVRALAQLGRTLGGAKRVFSRHSLVWIGPFAFGIVVFAAIYVWLAEKDVAGANIDSFGDAVWWALVTMMTVGYGESYPITTSGKVAAAFLMLTGVAVIGWLTAALASTFVENDESSVDVRKLEKLAKLHDKRKLTDTEFTAMKAKFIGLDQLEKLAALHANGKLTDKEFASLKAKLIG